MQSIGEVCIIVKLLVLRILWSFMISLLDVDNSNKNIHQLTANNPIAYALDSCLLAGNELQRRVGRR